MSSEQERLEALLAESSSGLLGSPVKTKRRSAPRARPTSLVHTAPQMPLRAARVLTGRPAAGRPRFHSYRHTGAWDPWVPRGSIEHSFLRISWLASIDTLRRCQARCRPHPRHLRYMY